MELDGPLEFEEEEEEFSLVAVEEEDAQEPNVLLLFSVPEEIQLKILTLLDPLDVLSLGRTCKFYANLSNNERLWRYQWEDLSSGLAWFTFPPSESLSQLGVLFKDCCKRLWSILSSQIGLYPKCVHCKEYTCSQVCLEAWSSKLVLDIGGKLTWMIDSNYGLKKHMSMIAVPKLLRCYDCDATIDRTRTQAHCDCHSEEDSRRVVPSLRPTGGLYCQNRSVSSHTGLEYCSQPLELLAYQQLHDRPICLFCEEFRTNRLLCEKEMVHSTKVKLTGSTPPKGTEDSFKAYNSYLGLTNGYCKDTANILGAENLDLLSPLIALEHKDAFPVVRAFLDHIFSHFQMNAELQRPNSCLVLTEPPNLPLAVKEQLLRYLFEEINVARLCLLPKALAISLLFEQETCVVIDSGATNTSVWVVLEGRVDPARTRTVAVGGWHVSQFLKQALTWNDHKDASVATVSSLDARSVKQKCRLSLNLTREEHRGGPRTETLQVKAQRGRSGAMRGGSGVSSGEGRLEYTEVNLSSELYLAPEMMYASLDLVGMVVEATRDLPTHSLKDCFSHILVQGGNTDLQGFAPRLSRDLREALPEHSAIINVCPYPTGNHSWNTAMGANMVKVPPKYDDVLQLHEPGTPFWTSREEYILFGSHQLTDNEVEQM